MKIAIFCETTGWTYEDYLNAPEWLISTLWIKWKCEAEKSQRDNKKI